jgi:hypothetical protein
MNDDLNYSKLKVQLGNRDLDFNIVSSSHGARHSTSHKPKHTTSRKPHSKLLKMKTRFHNLKQYHEQEALHHKTRIGQLAYKMRKHPHQDHTKTKEALEFHKNNMNYHKEMASTFAHKKRNIVSKLFGWLFKR